MGLFDGFDLKGALPKFAEALPEVNVSSFLPDLSTGGDVFRSFTNFGNGASSFASGMPSYKNSFTNSFSSAFGGSWNDFLPYSSYKNNQINWAMPWDPPKYTPGSGYGNYGGLGQATGESATLNQYGSSFLTAAQTYGLDPNDLMAIAIVEQGVMGQGDQFSGAQGIMQIMPGGYTELENLYPNWRTDPHQNIMLGAAILAQKIKENGGRDRGIMGYLGFGTDAYGTTSDAYLKLVNEEVAKLKSSGGNYTGGGGAFASTFGGQSFGVSSENGISNGMPASWYAYGQGLGLQYGTHPGIDVTAPANTKLYMPSGMTGTVEVADGTSYGYDPSGTGASSGPQTGQLRLKLTNGAILILGHMKNISVYVGQTINAGTFLGLSGTAGSGAHVHYEYRIPDNTTTTGYRSVDPRQYMG